VQQENFLFNLTFAVLALVALGAILVFLRRIAEALKELRGTVDGLRQQIEPVIHEAHQLTQETRAGLSTVLKQTQATVAMVSATTDEIIQMAHDQATELRALAQDAVLAARNQVERFDDLLTRTTTRVDQTTAIMQREVLQPIHELHCLVVGLRRGLQVLLARRRSSVDQVYQDEELFI